MATASTATINYTAGVSAFTISGTISRSSQTHTHRLLISCTIPNTDYSHTFIDKSNITSSFSESISYSSLASYTANSASIRMRIDLYTYDFSLSYPLIGSRTYYLTLTFPDSVKPTITSFDVTDAETTISSVFGEFIQNRSLIKVSSIQAAGVYGSTISKFKVSIGDGRHVTFSPDDVDFIIFDPPIQVSGGNVNVTVTVTDSRGRTAQKTSIITVLPYNNPSITDFSVQRENSSELEDDEGTYLRIRGTINLTYLLGKNDLRLSIFTRLHGTTGWTTIIDEQAINPSSSTYTLNRVYSGYSANSKYDIRMLVADTTGGSTEITAILNSAQPVMDFLANGKGITFFGVSTKEGFVVNKPTTFNEEVTFEDWSTIIDKIYPVGSIYLSADNESPSSKLGGSWTRLSGGYLYGATAEQTTGVVGGSSRKTLTLSNMPAHTHNIYAWRTVREASTAGAPSSGSFQDRVMVYSGSAPAAGNSESITTNRGSGTSFDISPAYIRVSIWKRIE